MICRLVVAGVLAASPLVLGATPALAQGHKQYCVVTTAPTGPQPPMVCVIDPTPGDES